MNLQTKVALTMRTLSVLAIGLCWVTSLSATYRFYGDIDALSPSGRYRITAVSPDNRAAVPNPFQDGFVYTCVDTKTKEVLWTKNRFADSKVTPVAIFVADDGASVIRNALDELICLEPTGIALPPIDLLSDAMTAAENERFVIQSSGGPMWDGKSLWYFLEDGGKRFFVIRPWWGRHIVIDHEEGRIAPASDDLARWINQHEVDHVMQTLKQGCEGDAQHKPSDDVITATYLAGPLQLHDAVNLLRKLEKSEYSGCYSTTLSLGGYDEFTLRQLAQLSLRRLGETPSALPAYKFSAPPQIPSTTQRNKNAALVRRGMTQRQVAELIGIPDSIFSTWMYDFDTKKPFSLTIAWSLDTKKVSKIARQTPPTWKTGLKRDEVLNF